MDQIKKLMDTGNLYLEDAKRNLELKKFNLCVKSCQLSLEKGLQALFLIERGYELEINRDLINLISKMDSESYFDISIEFPLDYDEIKNKIELINLKKVSKEECEDTINKTEHVLKWINSKLCMKKSLGNKKNEI